MYCRNVSGCLRICVSEWLYVPSGRKGEKKPRESSLDPLETRNYYTIQN